MPKNVSDRLIVLKCKELLNIFGLFWLIRYGRVTDVTCAIQVVIPMDDDVTVLNRPVETKYYSPPPEHVHEVSTASNWIIAPRFGQRRRTTKMMVTQLCIFNLSAGSSRGVWLLAEGLWNKARSVIFKEQILTLWIIVNFLHLNQQSTIDIYLIDKRKQCTYI